MPTIGVGLNWNYSDSDSGDSDARNLAMQLSPSGVLCASGVQTIGAGAEETLSLGDVTSVGLVIIKNMDDTNYVDYGSVTAQRGFKCIAGAFAVVQPVNNNIFIKANTAACNVRYWIYSA